MERVGDAYDSEMCESFFATLECELIDHRRLSNSQEAEIAVFDSIEGWHNLRRRHSMDMEFPVVYGSGRLAVTQGTRPNLSI
jgi:putative transposase